MHAACVHEPEHLLPNAMKLQDKLSDVKSDYDHVVFTSSWIFYVLFHENIITHILLYTKIAVCMHICMRYADTPFRQQHT